VRSQGLTNSTNVPSQLVFFSSVFTTVAIAGREYGHILISFPKSFKGDGMRWIQDVEKTPESDVQMLLTACTRAKTSLTLVGNGIYLSLTHHTGP
jgi:hypothetical protein